ncbi:E3 ubiquitin-protein ligase rad18 [Tilletia horrida]|nr:E3 ubiquitin-protein ligase rad18 [Tilletia horrida]
MSIASALGKGKNVLRGEVLDLDAATDPTDWEATPDFSFLRTLDNSLRCSLCYDIFTAPVVFRECHHTFCSSCIRSHINQPEDKGKFCPQCRQTKATDNELVPVLGLEEAAEAWRQARPTLIKAAESMRDLRSGSHQPNGADGGNSNADNSSSDEVEVVASSSAGASSLRSPRGVKRKLTDTQGASPVKDEGGRRTRQSTAAARSTSATATSRSAPKSPMGRSVESTFKVTELKATDLTKCPICDQEFTLAQLNAHLDRGNCGETSGQSPAKTQSSWFVRPNGESSSFRTGGPPPFEGAKRLTRLQYHGIKNDILKRNLEECGLPTTGSKDRQIARHREWVNIFNGNLDSAPAKRKTLAQLKKALKDFERAQDAQERVRAQGGPVPKDKAGSWAQDHKAEFADLVAQARSSHEKNKEKFKSMPAAGKGSEAQKQQQQSSAGDDGDEDDDVVEYIPDRQPPAAPKEEAHLAPGDFFA